MTVSDVPVGRRRLSARMLRATCLLLIGALLALGGWWAGDHSTSPNALERVVSAPRQARITAAVVSEVLQSKLSLNGSVKASGEFNVNLGAVSVPSATAIFTASPPPVGDVVKSGATIATVAGQRILVFQGDVPMYRDLTEGDSGGDVRELRTSLLDLGFPTYDRPGSFGPSTIQAIKRYWAHVGAELPDALNSETTSSITGSDGAKGKTVSPPPYVLPAWAVVFVPSLPATVLEVRDVTGGAISNPYLVLSQGSLSLSLSATSPQAALVRVGDPLSVWAAGSTAQHAVTGSVIGVTQANSEAAGNSGTAGVAGSAAAGNSGGGTAEGDEITGTTNRNFLASNSGRDVTVDVTYVSSGHAVLVVPVTALSATADGRVAVVLAVGRKDVQIPVTPGLVVGESVAISGALNQIRAGDRVLIPNAAT